MKSLRLGTRRSALARVQSAWIADRMRAAFPDLHVEIVLITTSGDEASLKVQKSQRSPKAARKPAAKSLASPGGLKALFTKEIEEALLDHRIDVAVHSLKDMSADLPKGLILGAVPEREDPRDAWISLKNIPFGQLPPTAKIGTGAVRRQAQIKRRLPQARVFELRGNVDTRLSKLEETKWDGIVLAFAGLKRLGRADVVSEVLPTDILLPAIGQGCLGIEIRESDRNLLPLMKALDEPASHAAALAERSFLRGLGGSCQTPIAGHAVIESGRLTLTGLVIAPSGLEEIRGEENGRPFDAAGIGERLAQKLLEEGAGRLLAQ